MHHIVIVAGGEPGSRLLRFLGLHISPDTLLRTFSHSAEPLVPPVRILGVDDFAFRKGHTYGTILVDLESHKIVDVLPDRSSESLSEWMKQQPQIEVVSRDRAEAYASGASKGAPQARQVADRWHLLKNLGDAIERFFVGKSRFLIEASESIVHERTNTEPKPKRLTKAEALSNQRLEEKRARVQKVKNLQDEGWGISAISRQVNLSQKTVRKYLHLQSLEKAERSRVKNLDKYRDFLWAQWSQGQSNTRVLLKKVREQGYQGSYRSLQRMVAEWREKTSTRPITRKKKVSARKMGPLFTKDRSKLKWEDREFLTRLRGLDMKIAKVEEISRHFADILLKKKDLDLWREWLKKTLNCKITEMEGFARGLVKDQAAVESAITEDWSNGQVEGQVNKVKAVKRQMYGRAGFPYLRKRVLLTI